MYDPNSLVSRFREASVVSELIEEDKDDYMYIEEVSDDVLMSGSPLTEADDIV